MLYSQFLEIINCSQNGFHANLNKVIVNLDLKFLIQVEKIYCPLITDMASKIKILESNS